MQWVAYVETPPTPEQIARGVCVIWPGASFLVQPHRWQELLDKAPMFWVMRREATAEDWAALDLEQPATCAE